MVARIVPRRVGMELARNRGTLNFFGMGLAPPCKNRSILTAEPISHINDLSQMLQLAT